MKIKSIASICKNNKTIMLYEGESCQWIGNGAAWYPLYNLPTLSEEHIFTMFDIPDEKKEKYLFQHFDSMPEFCLNDACDNEVQLERADMLICKDGSTYEPLITENGIIFINERYLAPFADCVDGIDLYERKTPSGQQYIAVKEGFLLLGIVLIVDLITEEFIDEISAILKYSEIIMNRRESQEVER